MNKIAAQEHHLGRVYEKQRKLDLALQQLNVLDDAIECTKRRYSMTSNTSLEFRLCSIRGVRRMFYIYAEKMTSDLEKLTEELLIMMEVG